MSQARWHMAALESALADFSRVACTHRTTTDATSGVHTLYAKVRPCPSYFSLVVGDIANNARAALDYIVSGMSTLAPDDNGRRFIQFPIWDDRNDWKAKHAGYLNGVASAHLDRFAHFQPFESSANAPLATLRELNNGDKHRCLRMVSTASRIQAHNVGEGISMSHDARASMVFEDDSRIDFIGTGTGEISATESVIATVKGQFPSNLLLRTDFDVWIRFADNNSLLNGREVLPTMKLILTRVQQVVDHFGR